ncbi:helix-turn-helix domain-containing protein [Thiohalospira halophila]|uniref:helix-turn-helix domain-containing protein n=1 Tax=Thiohalospira halophila TaxID=381300 RepID=UPI000B849958|nr:helix-turn-helix domain-containing protein [Thiohalospira halophila]
MEPSYQHLSEQERAAIMLQASEGHSVRSIARSLGRHVSTVSRELREAETTAAPIAPPGPRQRISSDVAAVCRLSAPETNERGRASYFL